ncbi:MAG: hypothetical protein FJY75_09050, partial [Candidatus Eisenbacteria bacterium]|nr:hypothetical protein [Candidatus Eisenbacteria bacterium]
MRRSLPLVLWLALGFSPAGAQETGASGLPEPAPRPTGGEPSPAGRPEKRVDGFRPAPRPTAGAPAPAPDSLTAPDSISTPESLRAAGPFPAPGTPDSLGPAPGARGWDPRWLLAALPSAAADTLLTRARLAVSSGMVLADALERESALGLFRAGGHGAWDQPYRIGPGAERFSLWAGGLPSAGPALPEANLSTMTPLSLDRLVRLAPDPLLDPLACGQDGLLWGEGAPPAQGPAASAVRLTQGAGGSTTEDFVLSRRSGPWGIAGGFAHSRADGRPFWIVPRYGASRYQNLALALDRAIGGCALRVTGEERAGRAVLAPGRKLVWESRLASAGWQRMGERSTAEALLIRRNDLLRWWGDEGTDRRRTTSTEAHLRGGWRAGSGRLLCAAAAERVALSYAGEGRGARSEEISGAGLAIAGSWPGERRSLYAAVGYSDPWWGDGHARAHLLAARRWGVWKL